MTCFCLHFIKLNIQTVLACLSFIFAGPFTCQQLILQTWSESVAIQGMWFLYLITDLILLFSLSLLILHIGALWNHSGVSVSVSSLPGGSQPMSMQTLDMWDWIIILSFYLFPSRWQPANEPADPRYVGEMRKPMLKFGLHAGDGAPPQSVTMEQLRETWGLQWTNGCVIQNMMWYCDKCCKSLSVKVK